MNIVFGAPFWEWRIREGRLAGDLLRPLNILHYDLAYFAGWKFVVVALWLPIAVGLSAVFHPDLHPSALQIVVFIVAIWGAYFVRTHVPGDDRDARLSGRLGCGDLRSLHGNGDAALGQARPAEADAGLGSDASPTSCRSSGRSVSRSNRS